MKSRGGGTRPWIALTGGCILVALVVWKGGFLACGRVEPGRAPLEDETIPAGAKLGEARRVALPRWYEAVATVRPRVVAEVAAQIMAQIQQVHADAGDSVKKGDLLITMDAAQFQARLDQAKRALEGATAAQRQAEQGRIGAEARLRQAESSYDRVKKLLDDQAATPQQMEAAESERDQARAGVEQAKQAVSAAAAQADASREAVREAEVALGYTRVAAPITGIISQRLADPGDLATPGKPLVVIHDPKALRLEAGVREGLIGRLKLGDELPCVVAGRELQGTVEEISPSADPVSRTFLVKVGIGEAPGIHPGMFARVRVSLGNEDAVLVPADAIEEIGQLSTVKVVADGRVIRRYVRLGQAVGKEIEILSGLAGGEKLWLEGGKP